MDDYIRMITERAIEQEQAAWHWPDVLFWILVSTLTVMGVVAFMFGIIEHQGLIESLAKMP